jgi:hypothetical protein
MTDTDRQRYLDAVHAMQSGVAMKMNFEAAETTPKHLRVGVNAAMCDHTALAELLIGKGVITHDEYIAAVADEMERERDRYQQWLVARLGNPGIRLA